MFNHIETLEIISIPYETYQVGEISNNGKPTVWETEMTDFTALLQGSDIPFIDKRIAYNQYNVKTKTATFYRTNSNEYGVFITPSRQ